MSVRAFFYKVIWLLLWLGASAFADRYAEINLSTSPTIDDELRLHVELDFLNFSRLPVSEVKIYYRDYSDSRFQFKEMNAQGFRYIASVDLSEYEGSMVEYFFAVEYANGARQQYPENAPEMDLLQVSLQQDLDSGDGVVVITPEPDEVIYTDEFLLTVSFFQYSARVDKERTKLYLNAWDVSRYTKVYDEFLTFSPRRVPPGRHKLTLELYDQSGRLITKKEWHFDAVQRKGPAPVSREFAIDGNAFAESRSEELLDGLQSNHYARGGLNLTGSTEQFAFGTRLYLSNQEKSTVQPINRYTGWAQANFWNGRYLRLTGGDTYPQLNPFLLNNIFLRGFYGQLALKFINFDLATGRTRRGVEGRAANPADPTSVARPGTFQRDIFAARTSFGARENFQLGLTVVKGKDDVNSIQVGNNPEESAGAGADIYIASNNKRLILEGSFNLSSYNPNIVDGKDLPLDTLEKLNVDIPENLYDLATGIITVNQYLIVIPGQSYHGQMRLNMLNNQFSIAYRYVQDQFHSLGQPYLLRDNKGFAITVNIRLFQNQLFLNLRYQQYENNLRDVKSATTENRTIGFNVSYFPLRNLPSLTFGYNNYQRNNNAGTSTLTFPEDNQTNTINFSTSYAFLLSNLRNRFTVNVLNYNRNDDTAFGIDNLSNTLSFILQTRYNIPLKTNLEFTFQQTENTAAQSSSGDLAVNSFGAGAEYGFKRIFSQEDDLSISATGRMGLVESSVTSTTGGTTLFDYNRSFLNGRLIYTHATYGRFSLNGDLVSYSGDRNFKDYIVTARYDVRF